ncbi:hypothetical protein ACFY4C_29575 [Actinomadura viridis]|uniref:hypothetical protein n=1 Tax=Actinomadura viridis TaxID=58110 RepID=UPI0036C5BC6F
MSGTPEPTSSPSASGRPGKQTVDLDQGTTGVVGGLRVGIGRAWGGVGNVVVLSGPGVPDPDAPGGGWRVQGKAGYVKKLPNGYTVSIDKVEEGEGDGAAAPGAGAGSVTVTVTPPE